jgi:hypothetical protein
MTLYKEGNWCSEDALVVGMADMTDNFMTSGNTIFGLREIKYLSRPEILLCRNSFDN